MMKLNLYSKTLNNHTKYINPSKQLLFNEEVDNFFIKEIRVEGRELNRNKLKKFKKICQTSLATFVSTLTIITPSFAKNDVTTNSTEIISKQDVFNELIHIEGWIMLAGIVLGIIMWQLAGGMKMIRRKKEANIWQRDIISAVTDIIAAPFWVGLIASVGIMVIITVLKYIGHSNWFINPF